MGGRLSPRFGFVSAEGLPLDEQAFIEAEIADALKGGGYGKLLSLHRKSAREDARAFSDMAELLESSFDAAAGIEPGPPDSGQSSLPVPEQEEEPPLSTALSARQDAKRRSVLAAVESLGTDLIPRSGLEALGLAPTSVDQDFKTYGKKEDRVGGPSAGEAQVSYRRTYLVSFVSSRWTPRVSKDEKPT